MRQYVWTCIKCLCSLCLSRVLCVFSPKLSIKPVFGILCWFSFCTLHFTRNLWHQHPVLCTSLVSLTTQLGRCGLIRSKLKIGCARSSPIGSPWSKICPIKNWNVFEPTTGESSRLKNSSNFVKDAAFDVNTWHPIDRSRMELPNAWIGQLKNT